MIEPSSSPSHLDTESLFFYLAFKLTIQLYYPLFMICYPRLDIYFCSVYTHTLVCNIYLVAYLDILRN